MEATTALEALFARLDTQITNGQTKRALKTADEILKVAPQDEDAQRCKVALLVDLGAVDEALRVLDGAPPGLGAALAFERAYCLYRQGRLQDALAAVDAVGAGRGAAALQLRAQLHYRLGDAAAAAAAYERLLALPGFRPSPEVTANVVAALVAAGRPAEAAAAARGAAGGGAAGAAGFELAYNAACALVGAGRLPEADEQLQLARRAGEEALYDEGLPEGEVDAELAPAAAQAAYVAAARGAPADAAAAYRAVLALKLDDGATAALAAANLFAAAAAAAPGGAAGEAAARRAAAECLRRLDAHTERAGGLLKLEARVDSRLGGEQRAAVLAAYAAAASLAGKPDAAREAARSLERAAPGAPGPRVLHAALLAREGRHREADAALAATPGADAALMRVQLALAGGGGAAAALPLLAALPAELAARPAVVATTAALLEQGGRAADAAALVQRHAAAAGARADGGAGRRWAARRLARLQLRLGDLAAAAEQYSSLLAADPAAADDPGVLTRAARAAALAGAPLPPALRRALPPPPKLSEAELDALEGAGVAPAAHGRRAPEEVAVPVPAAAAAAAAGLAKRAAPGDGADEAAKKRARKRRKTRLPKGVDPANPGPPPDPERWLPKWQRSDARKLRKKKGKDRADGMTKGAQGAGRVDESLDRTGAPEPAAAKAPAKAPPGVGNRKKKGRR